MNRVDRRNTLFQEERRAHRKWEVAVAIGATHETISVLDRLAHNRYLAFQRARRAEIADTP